MVRAPSRAPLVLSLVAAAAIAAGIIWVATGQSAGEESRPALAPAARAPVAPPAPRTYEVRVAVEPATARIVLDGSDVGRGSFERTFTADGKTHTLEISANEFESETVSFVDAPPPPRIMLVARPAPAPAPAPPRPPARRHAVGSVHRPAPEPPEPQRGFNGAPVIE
jgi:hypothetical protein